MIARRVISVQVCTLDINSDSSFGLVICGKFVPGSFFKIPLSTSKQTLCSIAPSDRAYLNMRVMIFNVIFEVAIIPRASISLIILSTSKRVTSFIGFSPNCPMISRLIIPQFLLYVFGASSVLMYFM